VSATIRTGTTLGARGVDLGLDFLARQGRCAGGIELLECFSEAPGGLVARTFLAALEKVDEILDLGESRRRQRLELLEQGLLSLGVNGLVLLI
jgi:hypothetical protein